MELEGDMAKRGIDEMNRNVSFPECAKTCEIVLELGVGECESVCPEKFRKDG